MADTRHEMGDWAEFVVASELSKRKFRVYLPYRNKGADILFCASNGKFYTIEVKFMGNKRGQLSQPQTGRLENRDMFAFYFENLDEWFIVPTFILHAQSENLQGKQYVTKSKSGQYNLSVRDSKGNPREFMKQYRGWERGLKEVITN